MPDLTIADVLWLRRTVAGDQFTPPPPPPQPSGALTGWDAATRQTLTADHPAIATANAAIALHEARGHELEDQASRRLVRALTGYLEDQHHPDPEARALELATLAVCDAEIRRQAVQAANTPHPCPACGQPIPAYRPPGLCPPCGDTFEFITREHAAKQTVGPDGRTRRQAVQAWAAARPT